MKDISGHLGAFLVTIVWGTTFVSSKVLLNNGLMPEEIFFIRFLIAYVCLAMFSHKRLWAGNLKDELTLCGLGIMGGSLYFLMENIALALSTAAEVCILICTCPLLTAMFIAAFYKEERMNKKQLLGSVVAFCGMIMVVLNGQLVLKLNPLGDILAFSAAITWGLYSLLMRRIINRYRPDFITRKIFFYGMATILPYLCYTHLPSHGTPGLHLQLQAEATHIIIGNILFLSIIASFGAYLLWNWAMHRLGAVRCTNYVYLQPMVTMLIGALVLNEQITFTGFSGMAVLTLGMARTLRK
ncbi:MAG: DMT family transporter [Bacteroidales bacterium]|nr:DMT family transporter [Bacteroidales bacterium]MCM1147870.1 DMT family transporter [Bacteroidales bacterium]MCM1206713.1 DMT family transporter [Bacillota bacterium]MCM1510909.1 DMT family transporter [Clostridium sp.]